MEKLIQEQLRESARTKERVAERLSGQIASLAQKIIECYQADHKVLVMGNGGSASDAQHIVGELVGRFKRERRPLPALALGANVATLTAIANDYAYEEVFVRQVEAWAAPGDVVIGITTSGNSANVIAAIERAKERHTYTAALLGKDGGALARCVDLALIVPSQDTPRIQEAHITIGHIVCDLVEQRLFS